jgi:hypothetical protein
MLPQAQPQPVVRQRISMDNDHLSGYDASSARFC